MSLADCVFGWRVLTVLGVCLPLYSAVKVVQPYRVESTNGSARIHCAFHPHMNPDDLRVTLLRGLHGHQELCSFFLNLQGQTETHGGRRGRVQCSTQTTDGAVEVTLSNLKAADTDIYRCEIQTFYPPPYLQLTGNGTLLHVTESPDCPSVNVQRQQQQQQQQQQEEEEEEETVTATSTPVAVLVTVIICVLVIIIYLQIVQCERNRREVVRTPLPFVHHRANASSFLTKSTV